MRKGTKSRVIGIFVGMFLLASLIVGLLGANDLIWFGSKLSLEYPRSDFHYELGEKPSNDLPIIKVSEENFRKIQVYDQKKICYVEVQRNCPRLLSIKFWILTDDCIFYTEKSQNLPFFRQIKNVEVNLEPEMVISLS